MVDTIEQKREQAKQYLEQRGINRANPKCSHRYDATRQPCEGAGQ